MARLGNSIDVAVIGAGPYGLSLAAHLRARGVEHRIFGEPMGPWKNNMPQGMLLKSYPWASSLSDPDAQFTARNFCTERALPYHDELMPLPLSRFVEYGDAFQARYAPNVERKTLTALESGSGIFRASFSDGETVNARRVVVAVGLHPFKRLPREAESLPSELCSHSSEYGPIRSLQGKNVVVVGAGSSATDLAALLHEQDITVSLVTRSPHLNFTCRPRPRTLLERIAAPMSGIGNGWDMTVCAGFPQLIRLLSNEQRIRLANSKSHGPMSSAFMKDRVIGKIPVLASRFLNGIEARNGKVILDLTANDGAAQQPLHADHVIFATGYEIDLTRLGFLSQKLTNGIRLTERAPLLSAHYESSVPGLHFIGPAAANSFGPVCRFVYGTSHPARHLARHLSAVLPRVRPSAKLQPVESTVLS
jgi:hypothetical protein